MAAKLSAGLLLYRRRDELELLLVHPGGPFWAKKDAGAWFIVKGEVNAGEDLLAAAKREFQEELGSPAPEGELLPLASIKQKSGKLVHAWATEGDLDTASIRSNTFSIEWPPRSGKQREFPEVDRARFFGVAEGLAMIHEAERPFIERLLVLLSERG